MFEVKQLSDKDIEENQESQPPVFLFILWTQKIYNIQVSFNIFSCTFFIFLED